MREENALRRFCGVRRSLFFKCTLVALSVYPASFSGLMAEDEVSLVDFDFLGKEEGGETFKINFNNVPITEYIRFISKISGQNFVFDETELQFNVTIVSEEPISIKNILSALVQILRIHNLTLLEEQNNLIITKNTAVNQIPEIISADISESKSQKAPLVTRIFRLKNANPNTIAGLIRPMVSAAALIEVSTETHQLIVTDILTNVDKIASLLVTLDTPHSPLEIESYVCKHIAPADLIAIASQIVTPFAEGHPLLLVPQADTNTIFVVSTPYLIERTMAVIEDLDVEPKSARLAVSKRALSTSSNFLMYNPKNRPGEELEAGMREIGKKLDHAKLADPSLLHTIKTMNWEPSTNTLLFTGDADTLKRIQEMVTEIDLPPSGLHGMQGAAAGKTSFFIYKPLHQSSEFIQTSLSSLAKELEESGLVDPNLLQTLKTIRYVPTTDSILFTGTPDALEKVQALLETIDVVTAELTVQKIGDLTFLVYKLQYMSAPQLITSLQSVAHELDKSKAMDKELKQTIKTMKWIKETNSILFTGTPQAIARVETLAKNLDTPSGMAQGKTAGGAPLGYVLYTPKYVTGPDLITILCDFEKTLMSTGVSDQSLYDSINNLKWMDQTSSLIITGEADTIRKVELLLQKFDTPSMGGGGAGPSIESVVDTSFLVYKLQYHQGGEIITAIKQVASELEKSTSTATQNLVTAINSLQWINVTNSLIATGEQDVLGKLRDLIENLDIPLKQVFIEVLVIETSLSNLQNFGLQWGGFAQYKNKFGIGYGNFPGTNPFTGGASNTALQPGLKRINATNFPIPNADIPFAQGFDLGAIGDVIFHKGQSFVSLGSLLNALQNDADSTVVLNPKMITQDTNNSSIFVGQNVPYTGSTLTITGAAGQNSTNIEYRDIGMSLSITPYLGNGDIITLEISNDLSTQITPAPGQTIAVGGILTTHASLNTRVHVPDQHFVVLSGMITDTKQHFTSGIPCLGGLPVIGVAFSENDRSNAKSNLIIFIRPQIIHSFDEYKQITDHQENLYKDESVVPRLKEEFDDGLNLVKQPNNE